MRPRFSGTIVLFLAVMWPDAGAAADDVPIEISGRLPSALEFSGSHQTAVRDAMIHLAGGANHSSMRLSADRISIRQYEGHYAFGPGSAPDPLPKNFAVPGETVSDLGTFEGAKMFIVGQNARSALVLGAATINVESEETIQALPPVSDRLVRDPVRTRIEGKPAADHFHALAIPGMSGAIAIQQFHAKVQGPMWIRWVDVSLRLESGSETREFTSGLFTEAGSKETGEVFRTRFFEARLEGATLEADFHQLRRLPGVFFRGIESSAVTSISVDSLRNATSKGVDAQEGASHWFNGSFSVSLQAAGSAEEPYYRFALKGRAAAFSAGGGSVQSLPTATGAGLTLAFTAWVLRDLLASLFARLLAPLYTKLRKDDVLRVPARESLFRAIREAPGIHFLELRRVVGERGTLVAFGALAYHLSQLERFQLITSKRSGRYRRYFETAVVGGDAARIALLQTKPVPVVARALLARPGASQAELHAALGASLPVTRQALAYHLRRLEAKELAVREMQGRFARYRPTERLVKLAGYLPPAPLPAGGADPAPTESFRPS